MRPIGDTKFGEAVAVATTTPIGIGPGRFHYAEHRCEVETVYLGTFRPATVTDVGGYDATNLQWAAEDQELNYRIRKAGGTIVLDPSIRSTYVPRGTAKALAKQYHNYGLCKVSTLVKHRTLPYWRPLVPAMLVLGCVSALLVLPIIGHTYLAPIPLIAHAILVSIAAGFLTKDRLDLWSRTFAAIIIMHWAYGAGFLRGIGRVLTGRKFDSRPRSRRV
jgi:hypothetical protein